MAKASAGRRVLVLNHFAAPRGRPGGTRHVELFSRLDDWDYLVVASQRNYITQERQLPQAGFLPVWCSPYRGNGPSRVLNWLTYAVCALVRCLWTTKAGIVYASSPHLLTGVAGWALARIWRVPLVLEIRDLWPQILVDMGQMRSTSVTFRALSWVERHLYEAASLIIYMAPGTADRLIARGVPEAKLAYVPNGADSEDFAPTRPRHVSREHYGFTRFTAVYAGAHGPANGLRLLLDAAEDARLRDMDIVLVGDGVQKAELVEEARRRGLSNVNFRHAIPKDEVPDLLNAADVGLHVLADVELFRSAVSPNKLFDYMAAGLPVLTNCPGYTSEVVVSSGCGVAVQPARLGDGLARVLSLSASNRDVMSRRGKAWMDAHQSRKAMSARLAACLERVVEGIPEPAQHVGGARRQ